MESVYGVARDRYCAQPLATGGAWEPWMGEKIAPAWMGDAARDPGRRPVIQGKPTPRPPAAAATPPGGTRLDAASDADALAFLARQPGLDPANVRARQPGLKGWCAMHVACRAGHLPLMRWLATHGAKADLDATSASGQTPLHVALQQLPARLPHARWLLAQGADARAANGDGDMPLHFAAMAGSVAALELLARYGALDASVPDSRAHAASAHAAAPLPLAGGSGPPALLWLAMRWAAGGGHLEAMLWLLERGSLAAQPDPPQAPLRQPQELAARDGDDAESRAAGPGGGGGEAGEGGAESCRHATGASGAVAQVSPSHRLGVDPAAVEAAFGGDGSRAAAKAALAAHCAAALERERVFRRTFLVGCNGGRREGGASDRSSEASGSLLGKLGGLVGARETVGEYAGVAKGRAQRSMREFLEAVGARGEQ